MYSSDYSSAFNILSISVLANIIYIIIATSIFLAAYAFNKKVNNENRLAIYNKTFNAYLKYNNIIFNYINLINEDVTFNLDDQKYKMIKQEFLHISGETCLIADKTLYFKINQFIEQFLDLPEEQETFENIDQPSDIPKTKDTSEDINEEKTLYLIELFELQKAMKDHLESIKP